MRKLVYTLSNGTMVNTLAEVRSSGLHYTAHVIDIADEPVKRSKVREAMVKQFGAVSELYKNKVALN